MLLPIRGLFKKALPFKKKRFKNVVGQTFVLDQDDGALHRDGSESGGSDEAKVGHHHLPLEEDTKTDAEDTPHANIKVRGLPFDLLPHHIQVQLLLLVMP